MNPRGRREALGELPERSVAPLKRRLDGEKDALMAERP